MYNGLGFAGVPPFAACADNLSVVDGECRHLRVCVGQGSSYLPYVENLLPGPSIIATLDPIKGLIDGVCNAIAGEQFFLSEVAVRSQGYIGEYEIGENLYSKVPAAVVTRDDDPQWSDFVNWVLQALLAAEEQGITQSTAADLPMVSVFGNRFENMFIDAVGAVGNFGEIYARHVEAFVPRKSIDTINTNGSTGLLFSHPFGRVQVNGPGPSIGGTLERIASRGALRCGVTARAGFGNFDQKTGNWSGLDADYCYALSASIFSNTSGTTVFVDLPASEERYSALANGDVDVLSGGSVNLVTDVLEPFSGQGFSFSQPYFYDPPTGTSWNLP